jgi:NAD(P)-dependent dehydrogenase (short-subunit alcohol dehydrogenase family)
VKTDTHARVPIHETADADFDRILNVNARGAYLVTKAVSAVMITQDPMTVSTKRYGVRTLSRGAIVNVASAMALGALPGKTPYVTSKHALMGITKAAGELCFNLPECEWSSECADSIHTM